MHMLLQQKPGLGSPGKCLANGIVLYNALPTATMILSVLDCFYARYLSTKANSQLTDWLQVEAIQSSHVQSSHEHISLCGEAAKVYSLLGVRNSTLEWTTHVHRLDECHLVLHAP
jgi:hypothetical protein